MSGVCAERNLGEFFQYIKELAYRLHSNAGDIFSLWAAYELRKEGSSNIGKHIFAWAKKLGKRQQREVHLDRVLTY